MDSKTVSLNPFFDLPNDNPLNCHVFCLPNAPSSPYYTLSHFAQKSSKFILDVELYGE